MSSDLYILNISTRINIGEHCMNDTDNIPIQIYDKCLKKVFDRFDRRLVNLSRVCKNLGLGYYPYPDNNKFNSMEYDGFKFELLKDDDDLFDIVYYVNMIVTENRFVSPFERCLERHDIKFDYREYPYKLKLFDDFIELIIKRYKIKPKIILHKQYIVFRVMVIKFVKTERLVLDPIRTRG